MNFSYFLKGIKDLVFNPANLFETSKSGKISVTTVRYSLFFPLTFLVAISAFFGSVLYTNSELSVAHSVIFSLKCLAVIIIAVYSTSWILGEITYPLDLGRDFNTSFTLVVFSVVPFLLCQILSRFFESLLFVNIISLYGLYVFWTGAEILLNPPGYKKMPLLISTAITFAAVYIATNFILNMLTERFFYSFFS
jgi:hypothetical protein